MTMSRNLGDTLFRENGVRVNQINPGWVLTDNEFINQKEQGKKDDWHLNLPEVFAPAKDALQGWHCPQINGYDRSHGR